MTRHVAAWTGAVTVAVALLLAAAPVSAQDTGWVIERFNSRYTVAADGRVQVAEAIDVDFLGLSRRGILRDLDYRFDYDGSRIREYGITLLTVTDAGGRTLRSRVESEGRIRRFRIGDPNRTVTGKQSYHIGYVVAGALNGFADHDELYWNATGVWPVAVLAASVVVRGPDGAIERATCYQGRRGSTEPCQASLTADEATFSATRVLAPGEQLTIVTWLRKGAVAEPVPILRPGSRTRSGGDGPSFFAVTPTIVWWLIVGVAAAIGGIGRLWWQAGRDRQYVALYHLTDRDEEERVPLFGARPIGVEFEPPEQIRPAQLGLIIDETADTLDVTATIVDLAVRGYLRITDLEKTWFLGSRDWQLDRLKPADAGLLPYERIVLDGLFKDDSTRTFSDLKTKFREDLDLAKRSLYEDAVTRGWFPRRPDAVRTRTVLLGLLTLGAGIAAGFLLGAVWGAGLAAVPVGVLGLGLVVAARAMPRRTAHGRELMRRSLGFEKYIRTAEQRQLAFAERASIFTGYLPYAVAFRSVDKWARAFKDIDMRAATAGWYVGSGDFDVSGFSSSLDTFASSASSALASTPGGSGGSGFGGGGSAGGGGGGGGGGSW